MTVATGRILWVAVLLCSLMGIVPPWIQHADVPYQAHFEKPLGYGFLFSPPQLDSAIPYSRVSTVMLDWQRLGLQWLIVAMLATVSAITSARRQHLHLKSNR